jgi:hypothetical protein
MYLSFPALPVKNYLVPLGTQVPIMALIGPPKPCQPPNRPILASQPQLSPHTNGIMAYMPLSEGEPRPPPPEGKPEQEPVPYHRASRFRGESSSRRAYFQTQDTIFNEPECDLSAYRFLLRQFWHVAVLGEPPPEDLERKLQEILQRGEPSTLPPEILKLLSERRAQATRQAPWVERHYRPGEKLDP